MKSKSPRQMEDDRRVAERAAEWVILLADSTSSERTEFINWIKESPQHLQEFLMASAVVRGLSATTLKKIGERQAQMSAEASNIIHLPQQMPPAIEEARTAYRKRPIGWAWAAGIAVLVSTLAVISFQWMTGPKTYATDVGEQRTIHLEDGSIMQLNARSQAQVLLTDRVRSIRLLKGEAMFRVKHDVARPFRVYTTMNVIQALGTQFNVLRRPSGTTVSVMEGKVQISTDREIASRARTGAWPAPIRPTPQQDMNVAMSTMSSPSFAKLEAGEEARIGLDGLIEERAAIDVAAVASWRNDRLDFRAEKLVDIAAEFNRYNETPQVIVQDDIAAGRRYSGVFDANDPRSLAQFLREDARLAIEEHDTKIVIRAHNAHFEEKTGTSSTMH